MIFVFCYSLLYTFLACDKILQDIVRRTFNSKFRRVKSMQKCIEIVVPLTWEWNWMKKGSTWWPIMSKQASTAMKYHKASFLCDFSHEGGYFCDQTFYLQTDKRHGQTTQSGCAQRYQDTERYWRVRKVKNHISVLCDTATYRTTKRDDRKLLLF